ncbi:Retrovirus-related Pol poly from transposon TNT 1-94 [Olea europaea subsp. europaea]|uniref:Retrovirus-related Pol poly from transposon TNT 1-94 n=1 Tax=Olea europaea subsp. europaea TaxID=158383 RepID=A0A8S0UUI5_OLEEU|nr:Retrovirus-related Pol poly from transposon TNT 1-94 [Olea europaea subsp. europaea]
MVQQMIVSTFSALGLQGKGQVVSSPWFVDSRVSNHMTSSSASLHNIRRYTGTQHNQITNGSILLITTVGDIGSSFDNIFISSDLSTNLIFVGQLVNNNFNVSFSRDGCLVQDQGSGKVFAKEPKVGRLF